MSWLATPLQALNAQSRRSQPGCGPHTTAIQIPTRTDGDLSPVARPMSVRNLAGFNTGFSIPSASANTLPRRMAGGNVDFRSVAGLVHALSPRGTSHISLRSDQLAGDATQGFTKSLGLPTPFVRDVHHAQHHGGVRWKVLRGQLPKTG